MATPVRRFLPLSRERSMATLRTPNIDFAAPGELFCARGARFQPRLTYKRFPSAAKAIQFAMEEMTSDALRGATLEVSEVRLRGDEIKQLYESAAYPLMRKAS